MHQDVLHHACYEETLELDIRHLEKPMSKFWYADQIEWYAVFRSDSSYKSQQDTQQTITCDTLDGRSGGIGFYLSSFKKFSKFSAMNMYFLVTLNVDFTRAISCFQNECMHLFLSQQIYILKATKVECCTKL